MFHLVFSDAMEYFQIIRKIFKQLKFYLKKYSRDATLDFAGDFFTALKICNQQKLFFSLVRVPRDGFKRGMDRRKLSLK